MGFLASPQAYNQRWLSNGPVVLREKSSVSLRVALPATQQIQGPEGQQDSAAWEGGNSSD